MEKKMMIPSKDGKRPLSTKPNAPLLNEDVFGNALHLPDELKKELDAKGYVWRFVDAKRMYEMNGYHDKGWRPYRREVTAPNSDPLGFKFGNDPDGIIRRGSVILAVKTKEQGEQHKRYLAQKAHRATESYNVKKAEELRRFSKESGLPTVVHEGYEENDE